MRVRRVMTVGGVLGALIGAGALLMPYARSAAFILDVAGTTTRWRALLPARSSQVTTRDIEIPTRSGPVAARLAEPSPRASRGVVLFPGVHGGGVDEPRLAAFSARLAATGVRVLSVPVPELRAFRITPRATDTIEDAIRFMADDPSLAPTGRVGVAGVSFAGGLALVAAGRQALAGKVDFVVSIGGHASLPRVMTYLCTGRLSDDTVRTPHDYGVAVILLGAARDVVPPAQVEGLEHAVRTFLTASGDAEFTPNRAAAEFADARQLATALPEPGRTYMQWVNDRNTAALGRLLLPFVDALGGDPSLSPERSPATRVPVFLLHGATDNVIPSSETPALAAYLEAQGNPSVTWLLTPMLSHAHVQGDMSIGNAWRLVSFWTQVLDAAR